MQSNKQFLVLLTLAALVLVVFGFVLYSVVTPSGLITGTPQEAISDENESSEYIY